MKEKGEGKRDVCNQCGVTMWCHMSLILALRGRGWCVSLILKSVGSTKWVTGNPNLHRNTLFQEWGSVEGRCKVFILLPLFP